MAAGEGPRTGLVTIERLDDRGEGQGRLAGRPVSVPLTLPGDRVMVRRQPGPGGRGEVETWLTRMPRADPSCRHFGICGGCRLQHLEPDAYRSWIGSKIERALRRHGIRGTLLRPACVTAPASRRRMRLGFVRAGGRIRLGLRELASHRIVDLAACPIARPGIVALFEPLRAALAGLPWNAGEVRITDADSGLDVLLMVEVGPDLDARERLARLAEAQDLARLAWRPPGGAPEALLVRRRVVVRFGQVVVGLPAGAFLQASSEAEAMIRDAVMEVLGPDGAVADLHAGCGTFALPLAAGGRRVLAADVDPDMIGALSTAAVAGGFGDRVTALVRDLERRPFQSHELAGFEDVVLDPPRAGALAQVRTLAGSKVRRVAMVSCNPSTFARDARVLIQGGFEFDWVQPVDAFLWSAEVELVGAFRRPAGRG